MESSHSRRQPASAGLLLPHTHPLTWEGVPTPSSHTLTSLTWERVWHSHRTPAGVVKEAGTAQREETFSYSCLAQLCPHFKPGPHLCLIHGSVTLRSTLLTHPSSQGGVPLAGSHSPHPQQASSPDSRQSRDAGGSGRACGYRKGPRGAQMDEG